MLKRIIPRLFLRIGYQLRCSQEEIIKRGPEWNDDFAAIYNACKPYTMTSPQRILALHKPSRYVVRNRLPGEVVSARLAIKPAPAPAANYV